MRVRAPGNDSRRDGASNTLTPFRTVQYATGQRSQMIAIIELRNGKIAKMTTWYAAPFEAPERRAPFVERFSPLGT